MSEDIDDRQRRYLISMGIRTLCLVLAVVLWGRIHWTLMGFLLVGAIILPYISVVFANGGRRPQNLPHLYDGPAATASETPPDLPVNPGRKAISGPDPEIIP